MDASSLYKMNVQGVIFSPAQMVGKEINETKSLLLRSS